VTPVRRLGTWLLPTLAACVFVGLGVGFALLVTTRKATLETLVITTLPSSAMVTIDGKLLGPSPVRIDNVAIGSHSVILAKDGFHTLEQQFRVDEDLDEPLLFELEALPPAGAAKGTPEERTLEFARLAEAALADGHLVSPYSGSALYYADALQSVDRTSALAEELRQRIRASLLTQARDLVDDDPKAAAAIAEQLLRAFPNDSGLRSAIDDLAIEASPYSARVTHLHGYGSCRGVLSIARERVTYDTSRRDHAFSYLVKNVRVQRSGSVLLIQYGRERQPFQCGSTSVAERFLRAASQPYR